MSRWDVTNPFTGDGRLLGKKQAKYVRDARKARANARRAMRSGNPAKRAEAAKVYVEAPRLIHQTYVNNLMGKSE